MELKDWLNSINFTKEDLSEDIKNYPPYIVNRCLSGHIDCVMYSNEMNKYPFLDESLIKNYIRNGKIDFSRSNVKLDSCKTYFFNLSLD